MTRVPVANLKGPRGGRGTQGLPGVNAVPTMEALAEYRRALPKYVTDGNAGFIREYNADLRLFNESAADLAVMRGDIAGARIGSAFTNILCLGDSKMWGRGASVLDSIPTLLRNGLGALDGFVYAHGALAMDVDGRWTGVTGFTATGNNLQLNAASNATSTATVTLTRRATGMRVWWYHTGSMGTRTVSIDGGTPVALTPTGTRVPDGVANGYYYMDFTGLTDTNHSVALSVTTTGGSFFYLGVEALHDAGITVTNAGLTASSVSLWTSNSSQLNPFVASAGMMSGRKIALVNLGTNTSTDEITNYETIVTRLRTLGFSVLNIVPGGTTTAAGARVDMKRAQYEISESLGMPLVDFTDLIGDDVAATTRGYMNDPLHENEFGYRFEASTVLRVLNAT